MIAAPGIIVREYGAGSAVVVTLHGGPAAAGDVAPLARELGRRWRVLEPFQRGSGREPLTVAMHVQDLDDVIRERCAGRRPVLVGHSWGAMLALAYAAEHPDSPRGLALVGCGTFSLSTRAVFSLRLEERLTPADRAEIDRIAHSEMDADHRHAKLGALLTRVYGYDVDRPADDVMSIDDVAHGQTWADMLRLQADGTYPAAFGAIRCPVAMFHGGADPHPGRLILEELKAYIPELEFFEIDRCGHSPWLERKARQPFFESLGGWIAGTFRREGV